MRAKVRVTMTTGKVRVPRFAGKDSTKSRVRAKRAAKPQSISPLSHRVLLQCMEARLQHGDGHGHARPIGKRFAVRKYDRRPLAQDHRNHEVQENTDHMDVVLLESEGRKHDSTHSSSGV